MADPIRIPAWQRPHWRPSDEEIVLQFYVFGKFQPVRVPSQPYGSDGLPKGIEVTSHHHAALRQWEGYPLKGRLGDVFKEDAPEAYKLALDAPEVLVVRGTLKDVGDSGYLRDTLGVLAGLLDIGGTAILDPQILSLFDAASWRRRYLVKNGAPLRNHVLILRDADPSGRSWIHTRGMRKFGRPDVSVHNVPERDIDRAGMLCERLIELQALGAHFTEGQSIDVDGLPGGLTATLGGNLQDPHFNNSFIALRWPD